MTSPKVRVIQLACYKLKLIGYNAASRASGFHSYQAVLWMGAAGNWWMINDRGYVVGKKPSSPWLASSLVDHHQIYLGRTLREAWAKLCLISNF